MKVVFILFLLIVQGSTGQTIKGTFPQAKNNEILLSGFSGFKTKELAKTTTDSLGNFVLQYPKVYTGAALLEIKNTASVIILLNQENFVMHWDDLQVFNTLTFSNSPENNVFANGIVINQEAENKLSGLKFLLPLYKKLSKQHQWLQEEIAHQEQQFNNYVNQLPVNSYAKQYLKIRKLVTDFPFTANRYIERMPDHEKVFNELNFNDTYLYTSGLLQELLEGYFKLMESHLEPKEMYKHINTSTDVVVKSLAPNTSLQQEVAQYLFNYFEKRSLFPAAEHLALQMLNQSNCQLTEKSKNLFEQYRKLALGKIAPNIIFEFFSKGFVSKDLKKIKSSYKLVVFGASWCPNCQVDYPNLKDKYKLLKEKYDLEIIYISIDTDKTAFESYYKDSPFPVFYDGKGWETQSAKDYHVFATPTYILLDKDLKILAKLNSPDHLDAWLLNR